MVAMSWQNTVTAPAPLLPAEASEVSLPLRGSSPWWNAGMVDRGQLDILLARLVLAVSMSGLKELLSELELSKHPMTLGCRSSMDGGAFASLLG